MTILKFVLCLIFISYTITANAINQTGFDEVCTIYTEAMNSNMSKKLLSKYIFDNIAKRVNNPDTLDAHGSVFQLPPKDRYPIFKQGAEISLKHPWNCDAIKKLMK